MLLRPLLRETMDMLIATRCIESDYALLCSDRDFDLSSHISG
jgi:hypothetical protein